MYEILLYCAAVLLALPLAAGYGLLAVVHFLVRRKLWDTPVHAATTLALAVWLPAALAGAWRIYGVPHSTAVLSLVYLPLLATLVSAAVFAPAWAVGELLRRLSGGGAGNGRGVRLLVAVAVLGLLAAVVVLALARGARWWHAAGAPLSPTELEALTRRHSVRADAATLKLLAARPDLPPAALLELARRGGEELRDPGATVPELLGLWGHHQEPASVLERVARHPNAPPQALRLLAADPSPRVAAAVARNPLAPPGLLARLARRPEMVVALAVAGNPATPPSAQVSLVGHPDAAVRGEVAERRSVGAAALARLAGDAAWSVRGAVALNPAAPPPVLARLAVDPDERVRFYVATNPSTPPEALRTLADDPSVKVKRTAQERLR